MRGTFPNARLVTIAAYRDACESVINKRVAMLTVKSGESEGSYRSNNHRPPCGKTLARGISVSSMSHGVNQPCKFIVKRKKKKKLKREKERKNGGRNKYL